MAHAVIIDDDRGMRLLASLVAEEAGWRVIGEAACAEDGVPLAVRRQPDVVVMDYRLPGIDGAEATAQIKRELPGARVVAWTTNDDAQVLEQLRAAGADAVLGKHELGRLKELLRAWGGSAR
jgi:DNA-binding NarL/FixJ family response regulator